GSLTAAEQAVKERLEALPVDGGITVTPHPQTTPIPQDGTYDLRVVTEDASGSTLSGISGYKNSQIPIITMENGHLVALGMSNTSGGSSATTYLGTITPHPINNNTPAATSNYFFVSGGQSTRLIPNTQIPTGATRVYNSNNSNTNTIAFAYDAGDIGVDGFQMPGRRVFLGLNAPSVPNLNEDGWKMFDRTVMWAADDFT